MPIPTLPEARRELEVLAAGAIQIADEIAVMAVANLKDDVPFSTSFDRKTEYFTEDELEQIVSGFRTAGFYCDVFIGEGEFIDWVLGGGARRFPRRKLLVYNTAQSGIGAGRKSLIPAFCMLQGIPTLNADPYGASLARHKFHVNAILRSTGVPVPPTWWYFGKGLWLNEERPPIGTHVLAKSTYESASIGISSGSSMLSDHDLEERLDATRAGLQQPVVVQTFVTGREAETPVFRVDNLFPLAPVGISIDKQHDVGDTFLSFERVCEDDYDFYALEEDLPELVEPLRQIAASTVQTLQLRGFCRVDSRIDTERRIFVTDVSTTPHLVAHSSYAFRFRYLGFDQGTMLAALVGLALQSSNSLSRTGGP